jgi:vacuolar-type H+-ATPase subunit I/STV1
MMDLTPGNFSGALRSSALRIGVQPIAVTAVGLFLVLFGIGAIALYRVTTGTSPESDRAVASRQLQTRTAQVSEQLVEKTKGLEATQQESIDQLQMVQDQLQTMRRMLASQQADTKKLSEQVAALAEAVEGLRQSFASAQANEPAAEPVRKRSRANANRSGRKRRS